ncbi:hypothetical protein A1Q2_04342 [Trichosporon asahii var. asahii CBS 8904]|uniref:Lysine decarboxylase n=1 Tax=Trichosporon asahii var. asahii (strain CBS 8904) TaxID=1220162 RepID=K1WIV5_TRIAC|nr:hypothetical protein A1Q2_04342 [Trichosporon asahii var. asahii CBS 8904]
MSLPEGSTPVCVFAVYSTAAASVGTALAKNGYPLVYGGGRRGLMGVVSSSALEAGGRVHGILPRALMARVSEHTPTPSRDPSSQPQPAVSAEGVGKDLLADTHGGLLSMEVVGSMHERKAKMASLSTGGFVVLPGGYGTFEELLEMVTWNQIGMHSLPVVVLNVKNFYTPLRALLEGGAESGFIKKENLSLLRIVDLPGGAEANADEAKAEEWGDAAIRALKEWHIPSTVASTPSNTDVSLFTTGRYTYIPTRPLTENAVPLWSYHVRRLRTAHAHFAARDRSWGTYPGDAAVWAAVKAALEPLQPSNGADWRVRIVMSRPTSGDVATVRVETPQAALPPFTLRITNDLFKRKFWVDTLPTPAPERDQVDLRRYKTTRREVYEAAQARFADKEAHAEVLLWNESGEALEGTTSNFAILSPNGWVTPKSRGILPGTARAALLDAGEIREVDRISVDEVKQAERVVCFNGLRGVWQAEVV